MTENKITPCQEILGYLSRAPISNSSQSFQISTEESHPESIKQRCSRDSHLVTQIPKSDKKKSGETKKKNKYFFQVAINDQRLKLKEFIIDIIILLSILG